MSLPDWNAQGVLPEGIHPASMPDLYERCVEGMPHRNRREALYSTLMGYFSAIQEVIPRGTLWIDGGFVMNKQQAPHDVDLAILPEDWTALASLGPETEAALAGFLTLQGVFCNEPTAFFERVQPFGGMIDAFLVHPDATDVWQDLWSSVKRNGVVVNGERKGFVEVKW